MFGIGAEKSIQQLSERSYSNYVEAEAGQAGRRLAVPRPIEIIKCKEGNKEYMKERPARKPYGRIVKVCEFSLEAVAEFGDDDARRCGGWQKPGRRATSCRYRGSIRPL